MLVDALLYRVILYNGFGSVRCLQNQPGILPVIGDKRLLTVRRNEDPRDHRIAHVKRCRFRCPVGSVSAGAAGVVFDAVLPHLAGVQNNRSVRQLRRVRDERLTAKVNALSTQRPIWVSVVSAAVRLGVVSCLAQLPDSK